MTGVLTSSLLKINLQLMVAIFWFHPTVKLDVPNFFGFTSQLKRGYSRHPNPYHNFLHAADVTQAMNVLLQMATQSSEEFASCLSPLDEIACVLAALSHDYRVPPWSEQQLLEIHNGCNLREIW
ncbi:hypothetical protein Pelo_19874 [Pelomyxa schiedti]|nr:hypothetical protein Pelo_19874 [Pelomyxa schiedti]